MADCHPSQQKQSMLGLLFISVSHGFFSSYPSPHTASGCRSSLFVAPNVHHRSTKIQPRIPFSPISYIAFYIIPSIAYAMEPPLGQRKIIVGIDFGTEKTCKSRLQHPSPMSSPVNASRMTCRCIACSLEQHPEKTAPYLFLDHQRPNRLLVMSGAWPGRKDIVGSRSIRWPARNRI